MSVRVYRALGVEAKGHPWERRTVLTERTDREYVVRLAKSAAVYYGGCDTEYDEVIVQAREVPAWEQYLTIAGSKVANH